MFCKLLLSLIISSFVSASNVALYWGQGNYESLASTCQSEDAEIILLSFLYEFGTSSTALDFSGICSTTFSDGLLHCPDMAADIKTCQSLGKKVLLSLGGASGAYGFSDDASAENYATTLWNTFGNGEDSSVERPFDDAVLDGFDFDIENNSQTGYAALATKLRELFASDSSKQYYLSAAPQCPYPDASVGDLLANANIDFAFIQFYNNYCSAIGSSFNWDTWLDYAKNTSPNKNIKLYLGLPASTTAASTGYATVDQVSEIVAGILSNDGAEYFGGIMLWDAYWSNLNQIDGMSFSNKMHQILDNTSSSLSSSSSSFISSTSITSSSSSSSISTTSSLSTSSISTTSSLSTSSVSFSTVTENDIPDTYTTISSSESTSITILTHSSTSILSLEEDDEISAFTQDEPEATTITSALTTSTEISSVEISTKNDKNIITTPITLTTQPTFTTTAPPLTTIATVTTSSAPLPSTSSSGASFVNCSSLNGLAKAQCLNTNFANGVYQGSAESCTDGQTACSENGAFAICNFGKWVTMQCAAGTTCYAYNSGDDVDIGCDYTNSKANFQKRDDGIFSHLLKRSFFHGHHAH